MEGEYGEKISDATRLNDDLDLFLPELYESYEKQIESNKALVSEINKIRLQTLKERLEKEVLTIEDNKKFIDEKKTELENWKR